MTAKKPTTIVNYHETLHENEQLKATIKELQRRIQKTDATDKRVDNLRDEVADLKQQNSFLAREREKYYRLYEQRHHQLEGALMAIQHVANPNQLKDINLFKAC